MKQKITCRCDEVFEEDIPEYISLDNNPEYIEDILNGKFMSVKCPACKMVLPLEFPFYLNWNKIQTETHTLQFVPQKDRLAFLNKTFNQIEGAIIAIGYPELIEKITILNKNLNMTVIESIKLYLVEKALSSLPDKKPEFLLNSVEDNGKISNLLFYVYGLKDKEVAKIAVPISLYNTELEKFIENPNQEQFVALNYNGYISVHNINFETEDNSETTKENEEHKGEN